MSEKIAVKKLPTASISLLGSGVMQWSKDKQIDVMQGMQLTIRLTKGLTSVLVLGFVCEQIIWQAAQSLSISSRLTAKSACCAQILPSQTACCCLHCLADLHALPNHYHTLVHEWCCSSRRQLGGLID